MNLLTKVRGPTLPTLHGAMLARVDCDPHGCGDPSRVPRRSRRLRRGPRGDHAASTTATRPASQSPRCSSSTRPGCPTALPISPPGVLAIVSAASLAAMLVRPPTGGSTASLSRAHRGRAQRGRPEAELVLDASGQPVYGQRDLADVGRMKELGLPFWLAGGTGSPEALAAALAAGANGIQVGTLFAYSRESGMEPGLRHQVIEAARRGAAEVRTDARSSSTGFPFKVVQLDGTVARPEIYAARPRVATTATCASRWRLAADAWPTGAPPSPLTPTWPRVGPWPTPWSAAACATACSPPPASPRCRRTARWSPRS